ncbi:hypothetical protein EMEDMD4_280068 [Sinorhizobium medicae]|uniref:Uncharacterized protein n=1 Tax=Sinorhizobium medicae TaxID=110321 RepID=A0A508X148_9HYPH|nr:hypothetical protein EMEDMD4_280068 [Sinorhizobium medicae]
MVPVPRRAHVTGAIFDARVVVVHVQGRSRLVAGSLSASRRSFHGKFSVRNRTIPHFMAPG